MFLLPVKEMRNKKKQFETIAGCSATTLEPFSQP